MAWRSNLTHPVAVTDGRTLVTLQDAADYLQEHFQGVKNDASLVAAIEDLIEAAEVDKPTERRRATDQLRIFLRAHRKLNGDEAGRASPPDIQARLAAQLLRAKR